MSLVNISIYWFTSKAFGPKLEYMDAVAGDYFTFILIGENALLIPVAMLNCFSQSVRTCADDGVLDIMLVSKRSLFQTIIFMGMTYLSFQILQMLLTLTFAGVFFGLQIHYSAIPAYFVLLLSALPLFIGLGLVNTAVVILIRRGINFFVSFSMMLSIASGAYFPLEVFPEWIKNLSQLSPFTIFLHMSRNLLSGKESILEMGFIMLMMLLVGIAIFFLGWFAFQFSIERYRLRGDPKLFWK